VFASSVIPQKAQFGAQALHLIEQIEQGFLSDAGKDRLGPGFSSVTVPFETSSSRLRIFSLCDPEAIEHRDFGKVQDECKDHCGHEYSSHNKYRQRNHGDSANRQG
jgi:hypothetical protein